MVVGIIEVTSPELFTTTSTLRPSPSKPDEALVFVVATFVYVPPLLHVPVKPAVTLPTNSVEDTIPVTSNQEPCLAVTPPPNTLS